MLAVHARMGPAVEGGPCSPSTVTERTVSEALHDAFFEASIELLDELDESDPMVDAVLIAMAFSASGPEREVVRA